MTINCINLESIFKKIRPHSEIGPFRQLKKARQRFFTQITTWLKKEIILIQIIRHPEERHIPLPRYEF